jgi:hypothetical protein
MTLKKAFNSSILPAIIFFYIRILQNQKYMN